jgi:hypothetical protein
MSRNRQIPETARPVEVEPVAIRVEVDDWIYRRSHGASPRGNGQWVFSTVHPDRMNYLIHTIHTSPNSAFGDAKREAVRIARGRGLSLLYVCP